jgi:predicted Zn finger-like uncharacterized protein
MIISCEECNKKFEIDEKFIPSLGRTLQCGSCGHKWFFKKETKIKKKIIINEKNKEVKKKIPENTDELIKEAENAISKKPKKIIKKKSINILSFLIVFIITIIALIILIDTFKNSITLYIPGFDIILNNLYESIKDIILFLKDLLK